MRLLRCDCEWSGDEPHYCVNYPKYGEPVDKVYRQERPNDEAWKRMTDADCFDFLAAHPDVNAFSPRVKMWAHLEYEYGCD